MKFLKHENNILNLIKYGAIGFIIILFFTITQVFIQQKDKDLTQNIQQLEDEYINDNKDLVKNLVNRIHSVISIEKSKGLKK